MKFKLEEFNRNIPDEEILDDLRNCFQLLSDKESTLNFRSYNEIGKFSSSTICMRFGTWNGALKAAGLELNEEKDVSEQDLFKNLESVWIQLGRQPVTRDLVKPVSKYTQHIYRERFGGYRNALKAFVDYINENSYPELSNDDVENEIATPKQTKKKRTSRNISDRMRFRVLSRDGFTCQSCGASPIKSRGVELHVDHITPWSKGGETLEENLQTKCKQCNLGKGNAFNT